MAKLLIVEDDPLVRDVLVRRLSREGFQVITASNGVQTIALARAEQPALILLDINLPMLNGWEVARRLRAIPETRAIPVIVLTGYLPPETQEQLETLGVDTCELKPVNFPQLLAKIRWLAHQRFSAGLNERQAGAG